MRTVGGALAGLQVPDMTQPADAGSNGGVGGNNSASCPVCGVRLPEHSYERAGRRMSVCGRCLDRMQVQDAYEDRLIEVHAKAEEGALEEAFLILDGIWAVHGARDYDGWLRRSIWSTRAVLLGQAGRLAEALDAYKALFEQGFTDASDEIECRLGRADVLVRQERRGEALLELEAALDAIDEKTLPGALSMLGRYAEVAGEDAESLLRLRDSLLRAALLAWGISPPPPAVGDPAPVGWVLRQASELLKGAEERYAGLKRETMATSSGEERIVLIEDFIAREPVDFYRKLARALVPKG